MNKNLGVWVLMGMGLITANPVNAGWTKTYGGNKDDGGNSVQQTTDNGYIVAGGTWSYGTSGPDVYLIKTNSSGDTLWKRIYGGNNGDYGRSVQQTNDGGYIVAGWTYSYGAGAGDFYLVKTNSTGDTMWTRTYGGTGNDGGYAVQQTKDSGYIISGMTGSYGAGAPIYTNVYLVKTNSMGDTLWTRAYGGNNNDGSYSVQQTSDGGYIVAGYTNSYGIGGTNVYLIKTNSSGDSLWTRVYGGTSTDGSYSVQQTTDNGYIVAGITSSYGVGTPTCFNAYIIKTNSAGDTLWTRAYGGTGTEYGNSIQQTIDNGYIIAGETGSYGAGGYDVWLIKINSTGDTLWTRTFGGTDGDCANAVQQTADKGYIVAGYTYSFGTGTPDSANVYLIKTDSLGYVGIEENLSPVRDVASLEISQNPFIKSTIIKYFIPVRTQVVLSVYDISGSCVKTLINGEKTTGSYNTTLNAKELRAGVYFVRLSAGNYKEMKKLVLMR
ncbi:MAG: T9SS type A sorting domain-containing protein [bacterium]